MSASKNISRKRFLLWGATLLSFGGLIKLWNPLGKKKSDKVKFLTQDGQLVEVDRKYMESKGSKIDTSELKTWIKK